MGLFSSKKVIYVASSVYNMAGEVPERANFLKTVVIGGVLSDGNRLLGETIVGNHLNGPGIGQRLYFRWARDNYTLGMPTASIAGANSVDPIIVANEIGAPAGQTIVMQSAAIEPADFSYWAEQHILDTNPALIETNWFADLDEDLGLIYIQYEDTSTESIPIGTFDATKDYLYATYAYSTDYSEDPVVLGTLVGGIYDPLTLPDTTGYTLDSDTNSANSSDLDVRTQIDITYSDATPPEYSDNTVTTPTPFTDNHKIYTQTTYQGTDGVNERLVYLIETHNVFSSYEIQTNQTVDVVNEDIGGGVIKTTTTTVDTDVLVQVWSYRDDTQETFTGEVGTPKIFIYEMGSGNAVLDALESTITTDPEFFPFIPLRINNVPLSDPSFAGATYDNAAKAFKKAMGVRNKITKILDQIEENENVGDLDYCFQVYGVSLNVEDRSCRRYIYDFLKWMQPYQQTNKAGYENFLLNKDDPSSYDTAYQDWLAAQENPLDPQYGTPKPQRIMSYLPPITSINLKSADPVTESYNVQTYFVSMWEDTITGEVEAGARIGDVTLVAGTPDDWTTGGLSSSGSLLALAFARSYSIPTLYVRKQISATQYTQLTVKGLTSRNFVYGGKSVDITSTEALEDTEESGFVIPMHYPTLKGMSLVDSTQVSTQNRLLLFNSYQIVKIKWYQRGIFKILLIVVIVVVSIYFAPAGSAGAGILGTNAAVGATLGFTGLTAAIVGGIVNALAAMVLVAIITEAATMLFGEKWGAIIGAIVSFIAIGSLTNFANTGSFGMDWGSMMRAENIMKLTDVGIKAYSAWVQGEIQELQADAEMAKEDYEEAKEKIDDLLVDLGYGGGIIDPMMFVDLSDGSQSFIESEETFLSRTLMTGDDIVQLSLDMISDYADMTLTLPKAKV